MIGHDGSIIPEVKVPRPLYDSLRAAIAGQIASLDPAAPLPTNSFIVGPPNESPRNSFTATLEIGPDVLDLVDGLNKASLPRVSFQKTIRQCFFDGLTGARRNGEIFEALSKASEAMTELSFLLDTVGRSFNSWMTTGTPSKQYVEKMEVAFFTITQRIEKSLDDNLTTIRRAVAARNGGEHKAAA
jgi:hypothetical protein